MQKDLAAALWIVVFLFFVAMMVGDGIKEYLHPTKDSEFYDE